MMMSMLRSPESSAARRASSSAAARGVTSKLIGLDMCCLLEFGCRDDPGAGPSGAGPGQIEDVAAVSGVVDPQGAPLAVDQAREFHQARIGGNVVGVHLVPAPAQDREVEFTAVIGRCAGQRDLQAFGR